MPRSRTEGPPASGMVEVELETSWRLRAGERTREMDELLIAVLEGVVTSGKLTVAADAAGISHRHARNLVHGWNAFLGAPLVVMRKGLGSSLTPLGESVLWAGLHAHSRLAPELEGLAAGFARRLNQALGEHEATLSIHASYDLAVALLRQHLVQRRVPVEVRNCWSFDALASLLRGECVAAGFHLPEGPVGRPLADRYTGMLAGRDVRLVPLALRTQGLIVARGNPLDIRSVADLVRPDLRMINRQRGSGTRELLESLLSEAGIDRQQLSGYEDEEITHSAVAALIAGRQADAGLGLQAAAARFRLDFVPLASERYFLAVEESHWSREDVVELVAVIASSEFRRAIDAIVGYHAVEDPPTSVASVLGLRATQR